MLSVTIIQLFPLIIIISNQPYHGLCSFIENMTT